MNAPMPQPCPNCAPGAYPATVPLFLYRGTVQAHVAVAEKHQTVPLTKMIFPQLPGPTELGPCLDQLERHPGSVILVAIEQPEVCNATRTTWAWLSREERRTLKAALEKARRKRQNTPPAPAVHPTQQNP